MRTVNVGINELHGKVLWLGYVGENEHTQIVLDCTPVFSEYPAAVPAVTVQPPYAQPYPAIVSRDGNNVVWFITDSDLIHCGKGEMQVTFTENGVVVKSCIVKVSISRSIEPTGEVPEPIENWLVEANTALNAIPQTINDALEEAKESGEFDGFSPVVTITEITGGHEVTITDAEGDHEFDVLDGHSPVVTASKSGKVTTVSVDGSPIATINDGTDGQDGEKGETGATPVFSVGTVTTGDAGTNAAVTQNGTDLAPVLNFTIPKGAKGDAGNGDMLAPAFAEGTANAAGTYVTYNGGLYLLPNGHTANTTWANTSKTSVTVGGQLTDQKSALSDITGNTSYSYAKDKSIARTAPTTMATESGYECVLVDCDPGDVFYVKGKGGNTTRLWMFSDTNGTLLTESGQSVTASDYVEIVAPTNAKKLACNSNYSTMHGVLISNDFIKSKINETNKKITDNQNAIKAIENKTKKPMAFNWEHGGIDNATGALNNEYSTTRSRDKTYYKASDIYTITNGSSSDMYAIFYTESGGNYTYASSQKITAGTTATILTDGYVRFDIRGSLEKAALVTGVCFASQIARDALTNDEMGKSGGTTILNNSSSMFVRKTAYANGQNIAYSSSTSKIVTDSPIQITGNNRMIRITLETGYRCHLFEMKTTSAILKDHGWLTEKTYILLDKETAYIVPVISKIDDTAINTDAYINVKVARYNESNTFLRDKVNEHDEIIGTIESGIPSYWKTYLDAKNAELIQADADLGYRGISFAFITDVHVKKNEMKSPLLLKYIEQHTAIRNFICGGDVIDDYDTKAGALAQLSSWREQMGILKKWVCLYGNHDGNSNNQPDPTAEITPADFYGIIDRSEEGHVEWVPNTLYGLEDFADQKVRFIYLDTKAPDYDATIDADQINWLEARLLELETGWTAVVFCHKFWRTTSSSDIQIEANGTAIKNAIDSIYDGMNATFACIVTGHVHWTYSDVSAKGYPIIATTCDAGGRAANDPDNPTRTPGTTLEQAFDLFYIDTANRTIKVIRIGAGDTTQNRNFTY